MAMVITVIDELKNTRDENRNLVLVVNGKVVAESPRYEAEENFSKYLNLVVERYYEDYETEYDYGIVIEAVSF